MLMFYPTEFLQVQIESREDACSVVRYVPLSATHLGKLAALNQLTRDICNHKCSVAEASERLKQCKTFRFMRMRYSYWHVESVVQRLPSCLEGHLSEALYAFFVGLIEQLALFVCRKRKVSRFLTNVYVSLLISLLSLPAAAGVIPVLHDKVVIGAIMPLVPGIALTTSIRDFYNGDYLSGTIHLIDALLTALCIAVGIALPILLLRYGGNLPV